MKSILEHLSEIQNLLQHTQYMNTTSVCDRQNRALLAAVEALIHIQAKRGMCPSDCTCAYDMAYFAEKRIQAILDEE